MESGRNISQVSHYLIPKICWIFDADGKECPGGNNRLAYLYVFTTNLQVFEERHYRRGLWKARHCFLLRWDVAKCGAQNHESPAGPRVESSLGRGDHHKLFSRDRTHFRRRGKNYCFAITYLLVVYFSFFWTNRPFPFWGWTQSILIQGRRLSLSKYIYWSCSPFKVVSIV